jgi:hypothetical protein
MKPLPVFLQNFISGHSTIMHVVLFGFILALVVVTKTDLFPLQFVLWMSLMFTYVFTIRVTKNHTEFIEHLKSYELRILSATSQEELDNLWFDINIMLHNESLGLEAQEIKTKLVRVFQVKMKNTSTKKDESEVMTKESYQDLVQESLDAHKELDKYNIPTTGLDGEGTLLTRRIRKLATK